MIGTLKERALAMMTRVGVTARVASSEWRRRRLLILCYHGVARSDEHLWNPGLYISATRFARRLKLLRRHGCSVLPLGEALERLARNDLPDRAVVLTFDDGYYDFAATAYPLLRTHGFPSTVYLTTLRCEHNLPIVRLLISYVLWTRRDRSLDGDGLPGLKPVAYPLAEPAARDAIVETLVAASRASNFDRFGNDGVARAVAERLDVDYDRLAAQRMLTLLAPHEVSSLAGQGVDFQLHTHRHRSPDDAALLAREIRDNRQRIERMTGRPAAHFCYPSGVYFRRQLGTLRAEGVVSATTCDPGLAHAGSEMLLLPRFVDTDHVSDNNFSSWITGTAALMSRRAAGNAAAL
jgi:peptidoglycan/xylan/chitin deacetylase (PgdA/CDA1 family)